MLKLKSVNFEEQKFQIHCLDQSNPEQLEWTIGRNPSCELILSSPEVSRVHGKICYGDDCYHFMDIGSTSGSLLNGELIPAHEKRLLRRGDLLQIGEAFLYVEELTPPSFLTVPAQIPADLILPEQLWTEAELPCRCCRIIDETPDVKTFCFTAEPPVLFHYKPGQFVSLAIEIYGETIIRPYSISSSPTRPYHLSLTVKRVPSPADLPEAPPGLVSNWLHDHLKVGDRVKLIGGALGQFTCLPDLPSKMLLISAGSGITPMMSMSRWVQDTLVDCDVVFLHSARSVEDIVFCKELETMVMQMPNFHLAITLTQSDSKHPWMGLTGRISPSMVQLVAPDFLDRAVYVCGPEGFMQGVRSMLEAMDFPMQNYREESFGGKKFASAPQATPDTALPAETVSLDFRPGQIHSEEPRTAEEPGDSENLTLESLPLTTLAAPVVNFTKSGQEVTADGNTSILELAEQEGIQIQHACRAGACGACKVMVCQGDVRYDTPPMALTPTDQQAGYALACVAYPTNHLVVEA
jgi:glycine betaine catabolism B